MSHHKIELPTPEEALPGRAVPLHVPEFHHVHGARMRPPFPEGLEYALFGLGCFWGAEKRFWALAGVYTTMVGYAGGWTRNPTYEEICSGYTGHTEVVRLLFDPSKVSYQQLLSQFWEAHNPTQGMRQGNDIGTQYRSAIYTFGAEQQTLALASRERYQAALAAAGYGPITTEIVDAPEFYYAEEYHQQYLAKHPAGYCGLGGIGVNYPT